MRTDLLVAGLLFVAAWVLRLYALSDHPFIMSGTEASIGLEAARVASADWGNIFGVGALQNPVLPFLPVGLVINLFGQSVWSARILSTIMGAAAVALLYLFGKRLWGQSAGLAAAVILLGNHTFLHYSRLGLTNIWDPLLVLLLVICMTLAWGPRLNETQPKADSGADQEAVPSLLRWLPVGLLAGLGAYLFTASRLIPLIVGLGLLIALLVDFRRFWQHLRGIFLAGLLAALMALPIMRFYGANPGLFNQRLNTLGVVQSGWLEREAEITGRPTNALWADQIWQGLGAFVNADDRSTYYGPERGFLNLGTSFLFLLGFFLALRRFWELPIILSLVAIIVTAIAGGILMLETPASHRYLVALPFAALLAGYGIQTIIGSVLSTENGISRSMLWLTLIVAVALVSSDLFFYFSTYQDDPSFADQNTETAHQVAAYLNGISNDPAAGDERPQVYLLGAPFVYTSFPNIGYLAPEFLDEARIRDISTLAELDGVVIEGETHFIVLFEREGEIGALQQRFPGGKTETRSGRYKDRLFTVYELTP